MSNVIAELQEKNVDDFEAGAAFVSTMLYVVNVLRRRTYSASRYSILSTDGIFSLAGSL